MVVVEGKNAVVDQVEPFVVAIVGLEVDLGAVVVVAVVAGVLVVAVVVVAVVDQHSQKRERGV